MEIGSCSAIGFVAGLPAGATGIITGAAAGIACGVGFTHKDELTSFAKTSYEFYFGKDANGNSAYTVRNVDSNTAVATGLLNDFATHSSNSVINYKNENGVRDILLITNDGSINKSAVDEIIKQNGTQTLKAVDSHNNTKDFLIIGTDQSNLASELSKIPAPKDGYDIAKELGVEVGTGVPLSQQSRTTLETKIAKGELGTVEINKGSGSKEIIIRKDRLQGTQINNATTTVRDGTEGGHLQKPQQQLLTVLAM